MLADQNLSRWRAAMRAAVSAAEVGDAGEAARLYHLAAQEAEQLLLHRCEDLPAAQIFVSSWQGLAECYRRLDREDLAFWAVRQAHSRLVEVVAEDCLPPEFRQECVKELTRSLLPLLVLLKQTPEGAVEAQRLINETQSLTARALMMAATPARQRRVGH